MVPVSPILFTDTRPTIAFTVSPTRAGRIHHVTECDVRIVLDRLPTELYSRLRTVHFNDRSWGARILGYVTRRRCEISLCALPRRVGLSRFLLHRQSPGTFGAERGGQWSALSIRRFMLYEVLLHEIGHLQIANVEATDERRKFALETKAEGFAAYWRKQLWSQPFDHPDPVHNPPAVGELRR
jgi:hypothetical protein